MTAFNGIVTPSHEYADPSVTSQGYLDQRNASLPFPDRTYDWVSSSLVGTWNDLHPLAMPKNSWAGVRVPHFVDDFYNRFHLTPSIMNLRVASDVYTSFTIWNAFFSPATANDVGMDFPDEFSILWSSGEPPFTIWTLTIKTISLHIPVDGLPQFASNIVFDFGSKGTATFSLSITRLSTFSYGPPLAPMRETLEWKTDIMTGADKSDEQRMSIRTVPRQGFQFSIYCPDEPSLGRLKVNLHNWLKRMWAVPVWMEWELHTGTISAGATTITVDTTDADFRDDSLGLIYQDEDNWEILIIETVAAGSLTLGDEISQEYIGDKLIMPLRICSPMGPVQMNCEPGFAYVDFSFLSNDNALISTFVAGQSHKGVPVLTQATYVPKSFNITVDHKAILSDYGTGSFTRLSDSEFNEATQDHHFKNFTKAECWEFREFLHWITGRRGVVYSPTFQKDMVQSRDIGSSDQTIYIEHMNLTEFLGVNDMRRDIAFVLSDGVTVITRRITAIAEYDASEETITFDNTVGTDIVVGACELSWLDLYRLASDRVTIDWEKAFVNECRLRFLRVKH
jgi:hypothetical protein